MRLSLCVLGWGVAAFEFIMWCLSKYNFSVCNRNFWQMKEANDRLIQANNSLLETCRTNQDTIATYEKMYKKVYDEPTKRH